MNKPLRHNDVSEIITVVQKEARNYNYTERLVDIYKRTYKGINIVNEIVSVETLKAEDYDYQIPAGSVPNLRLEQWMKDGWEQTKLVSQADLTSSLKDKYLQGAEPGTILLGVSWLGGGKSERLRSKSIPADQFLEIMEAIPKAVYFSTVWKVVTN